MFDIELSRDVESDLRAIRPYDRRRILEEVERQLSGEPTRQTKNRKILMNVMPPWRNVPPIWELRVGAYRVFYDVDSGSRTVFVRAVRHKPPEKRTEEIL